MSTNPGSIFTGGSAPKCPADLLNCNETFHFISAKAEIFHALSELACGYACLCAARTFLSFMEKITSRVVTKASGIDNAAEETASM